MSFLPERRETSLIAPIARDPCEICGLWRRRGFAGARSGLIVFIVQLAFNALWSWLFFVWRQGGLAFVDTVLLCGLIGAAVTSFWRVSRLAAMLLLPYLAWVAFASMLTWSVWRLNPGALS